VLLVGASQITAQGAVGAVGRCSRIRRDTSAAPMAGVSYYDATDLAQLANQPVSWSTPITNTDPSLHRC